MTTPAPERPIRFCPVCRKADDHPRHDFHLTDPAVAPHMACCRDSGCPDGSCDVLLKGADSLSGQALVAHLTDPKKQDSFAKALDARDDVTRTFTLEDLNPSIHGAVVAAPTQLRESDQA